MTDTYQTTDLFEAAAIWAGGAEFNGLETRSHQKFVFVFRGEKKARELSDRYWRDDLAVRAKRMAERVRSLKDLVFARRRNGDEKCNDNKIPRR